MKDSKELWKAIRNQAGKTLGEDFWHDIAGLLPNPGPHIDVYETTEEVFVVVELPGLSGLEGIRLQLTGRRLQLKGEMIRDYPVEEEELFISERFSGKFMRSLELPHEVSAGGVKTSFRDGLLTLCFRKKPTEPVQMIPLVPEPGSGPEI
jgi:HSP20 family protein